MKGLHFTLSLFIILSLYGRSNSRAGKLLEYCQAEIFNPDCSEDEVIIMQKAWYGHISLGKCVDEDFGRLGCYIDQLSVMDTKCSGKRSCELTISDAVLGGEFPCTLSKALMRYLEASFECQRVYSPGDCSSSSSVRVSSRFNYLSSEMTKKYGCGEENKPWELKASAGQRINITFTDFNWKVKSRGDATENCPVRYGYIVDVESNDIVYLCGGLIRERHLYISKGSHVQVLIHRDIMQNVRFLIGYKALGCPTYKASPDTWTEERDGYIIVGCTGTSDQWKMRCIGSHWLGPLKECSQYVSRNQKINSAGVTEKETKLLNMPPAVAFTLLGGIFLVLCSVVVTVVIGIVCIRKNKSNSKSNICSVDTDFKPPVLMPLDNFATYKSIQVKLPKKKDTNTAVLPCENPFDSISTLPSMGSVPRYPSSKRDSPHYYLLEGRDPNETEPLYDVVYQGLPTQSNA